MAQTIEQKIAAKEAELARLRLRSRQLENGQKIILGGLLLQSVRTDPVMRKWLITEAKKHVTREADKNRLAPLIEELKRIGG